MILCHWRVGDALRYVTLVSQRLHDARPRQKLSMGIHGCLHKHHLIVVSLSLLITRIVLQVRHVQQIVALDFGSKARSLRLVEFLEGIHVLNRLALLGQRAVAYLDTRLYAGIAFTDFRGCPCKSLRALHLVWRWCA